MQVDVTDVRTGDFVLDFGVVKDIKYFYTNVAQDSNDIVFDKNENFLSQIVKEVDSCYKKNVDKIVLYTDGSCKTYYADSTVNVIRSKKVVFKKVA
jgi:hypothetical protein